MQLPRRNFTVFPLRRGSGDIDSSYLTLYNRLRHYYERSSLPRLGEKGLKGIRRSKIKRDEFNSIVKVVVIIIHFLLIFFIFA